jgi:hypothetical protein
MNRIEDWKVVARFCVPGEGWKTNETKVDDATYAEAGQVASRIALSLDKEFGDTASWTVDLYSVEHPEHRSYYQLFHGRLS